MIIGYARVSTKDQNLDRQLKELQAFGCEKIFEEKRTGKDFNRPVYLEMKSKLRFGDVLVIHDLSRFGRNKDEVRNEWKYFIDNEIDIVVLNMPILDTRKYKEMEGVLQLVSDLVFTLLTWVVDDERKRSKVAQIEGISIAKTKGKYKGRPTKYSADAKNPKDRLIYETIVSELKAGTSVIDIHKKTGVSRTTIYNMRDQNENNTI